MEEMLRIVVEGDVQGVGFRYFTERLARGLGIAGWVRNLPGGEVELVARVPPERKAEFLHALRRGPSAARVTGLRVGAPPESYTCPERGFSISA